MAGAQGCGECDHARFRQRPAAASRESGQRFPDDDRALAPREATRIPPGLVEVRIYYLDDQPGPVELQRLEALQGVRGSVGGGQLAVMHTEPSANTFARLPVREGEVAIAVFSQFRDAETYARYRGCTDRFAAVAARGRRLAAQRAACAGHSQARSPPRVRGCRVDAGISMTDRSPVQKPHRSTHACCRPPICGCSLQWYSE